MDEQVAAGKIQMEEESLQSVEKELVYLGGIKEYCQSM